MNELRRNRTVNFAVIAAIALSISLAPPVVPTADAGCPPVLRSYTETYWYQAFVSPTPPAEVTGECTYYCDGTVDCWGYKAPWAHNWVEYTYHEWCGPCTPDYE